MVTVDNFASKLCSIILAKNPENEIQDWRLLGQEHDGSLLFSWVESVCSENPRTHVGVYSFDTNLLEVIYSFQTVANCVQASLNIERTYLALVIKESNTVEDEKQDSYKPFLFKMNSKSKTLYDLHLERSRQVLVQFLHQKKSVLSENQSVKFLVLIHHECILQYHIKSDTQELNDDCFIYESLVRMFTWAQWDPIHETLYYIHNRKPTRCLIEGEEDVVVESESKVTPTLSGLQFHDDLPHESVLNIPLNLPHPPCTPEPCKIYEDDAVPLRIHDCSLDLVVLTDSKGIVCICHHYLYQPIHPMQDLSENDTCPVHFAYSVTVLHQSCVIHCVVPEIPWNKVKTIRPVFKLSEDYLMVFIPDICTHLLDIGVMHEPICHITTKPLISDLEPHQLCLAPLVTLGQQYVVNLATLDLIDLTVPASFLIDTFKSETLLENKLSILHYFILHSGDTDTASELISWQAESPFAMGLPSILKEFLIGSSYASVQRNLPTDASSLISLLPISTQRIGCDIEVKLNDTMICLSQDALWNASMMLLSPQQRIVPYRTDVWVKLWEHLAKLSKGKQRFKSSQVVEKLKVSLVCYQPEVLSRSSTPMSPGTSLGASTALNDFLNNQCGKRSQIDGLPFYEVETCTASKQEHIISVNLRELSMHLLKQCSENRMSRFQWQSQAPMHVHAVATRYITAQLDQSRYLCQILCQVASYEPRHELDKGFVYVNQISDERRHVLFTLLERYYLVVESTAFPLPQGFTSFFTYLGYKTLNFDMFLQYVIRNVFELHVDVMKVILADIGNTKLDIQRKLKLLTLLPRSRSKRLLNQWNHPVSLMLRAREHSSHILSGIGGTTGRSHGIPKNKGFRGLTALPSDNQLSPLNTFLDLLTAKASLTDLDFGLLIEATESATDDFL